MTQIVLVRYSGTLYRLFVVNGRPEGVYRKVHKRDGSSHTRVVSIATPRWYRIVAQARDDGLIPRRAI